MGFRDEQRVFIFFTSTQSYPLILHSPLADEAFWEYYPSSTQYLQ